MKQEAICLSGLFTLRVNSYVGPTQIRQFRVWIRMLFVPGRNCMFLGLVCGSRPDRAIFMEEVINPSTNKTIARPFLETCVSVCVLLCNRASDRWGERNRAIKSRPESNVFRFSARHLPRIPDRLFGQFVPCSGFGLITLFPSLRSVILHCSELVRHRTLHIVISLADEWCFQIYALSPNQAKFFGKQFL